MNTLLLLLMPALAVDVCRAQDRAETIAPLAFSKTALTLPELLATPTGEVGANAPPASAPPSGAEAEQKSLSIENAILDEKSKKELAELRHVREKIRLEYETERDRVQLQMARFEVEKGEIDLESRRLDLQAKKADWELKQKETRTQSLAADLELRSKKEDWRSLAEREPEHPLEPFKDGVLTVSDRRIALNGPITQETADVVTDWINFYNNQSEQQPIFIMIDRSPGGSVMAGHRILRAMAGSKAPVNVVVRSYAASMAAVIAALAPKSYAFPDAVILHHQMSSSLFGNMTQMKEQMDMAQEWQLRLCTPVAKKMGISIEEFTRRMYARNSEGDWQEFGDKAKQLHWIDEIVYEVREVGVTKSPAKAPAGNYEVAVAETDSKGEKFLKLPRLQPFDLYYLYNRDGYYR